jgi:hypothetical protein
MTSKHRESHDIILSAFIAFFCLLAILLALFRQFDHDEFEHIHSAWFILQGKIPYLDFYQSHNPALWYLLAPFIHFFGEGTAVLFIARSLMLLFLAGIVLSVRALSRETGSSIRESNYAMLLVLSCWVLVNKSYEIRPDVPQVFFGLLSCLYFIRYIKNKMSLHMVQAGFMAGVSFVMLQKSIFLFAAMVIAMLWLLWRKEISLRAIFLYAIGTILPLVGLIYYLMATGCFGDYIMTNWILHMNKLQSFSPLKHLFNSILENTVFWGLAGLSLWTCLVKKQSGALLQIISFCGLLYFGSLFLVPCPHKQYFIFLIALLAVPAARQAILLFEQFKCSETCRNCLLVLALIAPVYSTASALTKSNRTQLQMIRYVINWTAPGHRVYDGDVLYNLYRPDLHYFWFSVKPLKGLDSYNRIFGNRLSAYDIYQLILEKKPVFISDVSVNINDPRIAGMYQSTPFSHLYRISRASR